jgi:hypothetical protein
LNMSIKTIAIPVIIILMSLTTGYGQGLQTMGEIFDGSARDIASGYEVLYLAQGRNLAILDPETGLRTHNFNDEPYPHPLVAVEFDKEANRLFVATERHVYIHDKSANLVRVWENEHEKTIGDIECVFEDQVMLVILSDQVVLVDYSSDTPSIVSSFGVPPGIMNFQRPHIALTRNGQMAYLTGFIIGQPIRNVNGLVIVDLDSENGYTEPLVYPTFWNPSAHYSSAGASALNVQVLENYKDENTYAFLACGLTGQLTVLDVTQPDAPFFVDRKLIFEGFPVFHVLLDNDASRLFVASANILHILDIQSLEVLGSRNTGFWNAGARDMALHYHGNRKQIWTATHYSVNFVINGMDVTTNQVTHPVRQWWISSSDGAVAVPEWHSVYIPTFGGIVRYDVSDETFPVAVNESYQPAVIGGVTEHIDIMFPDPDNRDHALLLTAPGVGGVQYWAVSKSNPNPSPPIWVVQKPAHWGSNPVYQNDVGHFRKNGVNYFLADLANRITDDVALQIYNTESGAWIDVIEQSPDLKANAHAILLFEEYAFVTCNGGFFVVDLSQLPHNASITDVVINDWNNDGRPNQTNGIMIRPDGAYVFVAHDPGVIQSYAFDKATGKVTGPLHILYGEGITGCTNRGRYFGPLDRLYVAGRGGNIMEIDACDPYNMKLLSVWNNGAYKGEMQDCHIYDFGYGPRVLAVKNNEGFAILKIDNSTSVQEEILPQNIILLVQNYPNPFNYSTAIRWQSLISGQTTLVIFDVLGKKVKTLVDDFKHQGEYTVHFDGGDISSGIYFYQLRVGEHITTNKLILTK